jgi:serine/threonine protein phosphatase PrpC
MWQIIAESIKSANHPLNQDAKKYFIPKDKEYVVVAVADGHGSRKCFRSNIGSEFAVEVLLKIFRQYFSSNTFDYLPTGFSGTKENLAKTIHRQWLEKVKNHLVNNPFSPEEELVDIKVLKNQIISYGTTLLGALITKNYIIYLQLGDGDILVVSENAVTRPIPKDENLIANETYSLCDKEADSLFRFYFQPIIGQFPDLILLSTDGYSNSFPNDNEFQKTALDYNNLYKEEGLDFIRKNITGWLTDTTVHGSGDDLTTILVFKTLDNESTTKRETDITN